MERFHIFLVYLEVDVVDVFLVKVSTEELRLSVVVFSSLLIGGEVW